MADQSLERQLALRSATASDEVTARRKSRCVRRLKSRFYGSLLSPRQHYRRAVLARLRAGARILDVGCGYEAPDLTALPHGFRVGTDVIQGLQCFDSRDAFLVRSNCEQLPFSDGSFDVVMCRSVIEHLEHPKVVFREIVRVLAPNGHFVFLTPNRWDYVSLVAGLVPNRFHGWIVRKLTGRCERDTFPTVYRANTQGSLRKFASETGFDVVELGFLREHPHYLQFSAAAYVVGVAIEQLFQRAIPHTRPWILGVWRRS